MAKEKVDEKQYLRDSLIFFYESKVNYDKHTQAFNEIKQEFESDMDLYFDKYANENNEIRVKTTDMYMGLIGVKVKKVEPTKVVINPMTFIRRCTDKILKKKVIHNGYKVTDIMGLLNFLKDKGITYKDVKQFIKRVPTVDYDALNNAVELGEVDAELVKECSQIEFKKPYYRFTPIRQKNPVRKPVV